MIYYRKFYINKDVAIFLVAVLFSCLSFQGRAEETNVSHAMPKNALYSEDCRSAISVRTSPFWETNFSKAFERAKLENKPLIVAFLATSWCPWSQKLFEEVLAQEAFVKTLQDEFLLLQIELNDPVSGTAFELKKKYNIEQCPMLVFLTPEGEEMTRLGFLAFSPDEYGKHVKQLVGDYKEIEEALALRSLKNMDEAVLKTLYAKAKALGCKKFSDLILQEGLERTGESFFLLEKYAALIEQHKMKLKHPEVQELREKIIHCDPHNKQGSQLNLAILEFKALAGQLKKQVKPSVVIQPLMEYVKRFGKNDSENHWKVEMMMAQYLFSQNLTEAAIDHALFSYKCAPVSAQPEIVSALDYLKRHYDRTH